MNTSNAQYMPNLISKILALDIDNIEILKNKLCEVFVNEIPGIIFISLLAYNKNADEITYNSVAFHQETYDSKIVVDLIKDNLRLSVNDSTAGRLIKDRNKFNYLLNIHTDENYKSKKLATSLGLKKAYFLKLSDKRTGDVFGILVIYPSDNSPILNISDECILTLISVIENVISNAKRLKEYDLVKKILEAAEKVKKDLSSFLQKCVSIISAELSATGCSIFIQDFDELLKLKATLGVEPGPALMGKITVFKKADVYYHPGEGVTGKVLSDNKMYSFHKLDTSKSKWIDVGARASCPFLGIPIPKIGETSAIGVIRCSTKPNKILNSAVESFNHEDVEILNYIAKLISVFVELARFQDSQKQMLAKMPHEIKSSLASIKNHCIYFRSINNKLEADGYFVDNLAHKIKDVEDECEISYLNVSGIDVFDHIYEHYKFKYTDLFQDVITKIKRTMNSSLINEKQIEIRYFNVLPLPKLFVDRYRMQIVFYNLLVNAKKYSYRQKARSDANNITITSGLSDDRKNYLISISNTGISIPESRTEEIFINGVRIIDAVKMDPTGKGFGLALVKQILKIHGINIKVTSPGKPTTFTLFIPLWLKDHPPLESA